MMQAQPRRLPVEVVVKRAYQFAWESRDVLAGPYFIYAALTILAELIVMRVQGPGARPGRFVLEAAEQMFAVAFAVGIHRYVLLAEVRPGFRFFRWDRHFVQYALVAVALLIVVLIAALMVVGLMGGAGGEAGGAAGVGTAGVGAFFGLTLMIALSLVLSRLALALPLAAIGDNLSGRTIWQATEGNGLRLVAAMLLTVMPFLIVYALFLRLDIKDGSVGDVMATIVLGLVSPIQLIVMAIMLALSYDALVRGGGPLDRRAGSDI